MKAWWLALLLVGVMVALTTAQKQQPGKTFSEAEQSDEDDQFGEDDDDDYTEEEVDIQQKQEEDRKNPCIEKECRRGEMCVVEGRRNTRARCVCIPQCNSPEPNDLRYEVCSKKNKTYISECALDRDHCLCRRRKDGCSSPGIGKIRLDYYGPCQELTPCSEREFKQFPARMREWLYVVMQQKAQRAEIPNYLQLLEKARQESNHTHAVTWKFCDLDSNPHDRFVTRRELLYTIQSLKALEHCLIPFLDQCDANTDSKITLWEWGRCLGIEEDKIKDDCINVQKSTSVQK